MLKTCCQVLHQANPFSGHCHILSSPVRQVLRKNFAAAEPCRTCPAPPSPLQAEQQHHQHLSLWGHLSSQAGGTASTEGRQQKAQRMTEFPYGWTAQNPEGWILRPVVTPCLWDFLFPFPSPKLNLLFHKFFQYFPPLTHSGSVPT